MSSLETSTTITLRRRSLEQDELLFLLAQVRAVMQGVIQELQTIVNDPTLPLSERMEARDEVAIFMRSAAEFRDGLRMDGELALCSSGMLRDDGELFAIWQSVEERLGQLERRLSVTQ